jgi:FtsX-like permease family
MADQSLGAVPRGSTARHSGGHSATWVFLANSWRARWRSLLVLALMIGLTGGAVIAAAAGARRSATSLERFSAEARTFDVFVAADITTEEPAAMRALLDGPLVESANDLAFLFVDSDSTGFFFGATSRRGLDVERGVLLEGRRADPDEPDEIVLSDVAAEGLGLGVGDTFELGTLTPQQADVLLNRGEMPTSLDGPRPRLQVVGIVRNGSGLLARPGDESLTITTPAFMEEYGDRIGVGSRSHMVRLVDAPGAVDQFTEGVAEAYGGAHLPSINVGQGEETVDDSISVVTAALIAMGIVVAVAGLVWVASAVARHQRGAASDIEVLRALGSTPGQRRTLLVGVVAPALAAGPVAAIGIAVILSPLFPVGAARRVDPDPGLHADLSALLVGALAVAVVVVLGATLSAVRLVGQSRGSEPATVRVPRLVDHAARRLRPAPGTGVRFALHSPRRVSVPVRPALAGALVGVVGLVAVAVVGTSMQRLVDTPARWGTTWDVAVGGEAFDPEAMLDDADIEAAAILLYDEQVTVDGVEAIGMTLDAVKGGIIPTIVEGREPRAADEIALGRDTLDAVDVPVGATVTVRSRAQASEQLRVVGVIAFPTIGGPAAVATGAALTSEGGDRLLLGDDSRSDDVGTAYMVIRWAPGVDHDSALAALEAKGAEVVLPTAPPEVRGLRDVRRFPMVAAGALIVLGVIATTHALVVTVRRRRLEFGVLSALGLTPSQRRTVVAVQATTVACVALVVGVPLGLLLGRAVWAGIAGAMGVADDSVMPLPLLVAGAVVLIVVLNLIGAVPARSARRLRVADALRAE